MLQFIPVFILNQETAFFKNEAAVTLISRDGIFHFSAPVYTQWNAIDNYPHDSKINTVPALSKKVERKLIAQIIFEVQQ